MTNESTPVVSKGLRWTGYVLSTLSVLMLLFSASGKFLQPAGMEVNVEPLGWKMSQMTSLGILEVACALLYVIPRTSVLGAVLVTAYLGGATATHVRIGDPFFFPVILGIVVWIGLYLREPRLWPLAPFRR
ncbi:MAG: DoxX family protein [Pyrinomonadaceae bacterium]